MKITLILGSLVLLLISCATVEEKLQEEGIKPLSQAELETLYQGGRTLNFKSARASGTAIYHTDGKCEINWGRGTDTGVYSLRDGMICTKWTKIRDGKEGCFKIYKVGDNKYKAINLDGTLNSESSLKQ
jgi:hypothetical protein